MIWDCVSRLVPGDKVEFTFTQDGKKLPPVILPVVGLYKVNYSSKLVPVACSEDSIVSHIYRYWLYNTNKSLINQGLQYSRYLPLNNNYVSERHIARIIKKSTNTKAFSQEKDAIDS